MRIALVVLFTFGCGSKTAPTPVVAAPPAPPIDAAAPAKVVESRTAEQQYQAWLTAFNTADVETIRAAREKTFAADGKWPSAEDAAGFSNQTGGFEIVKAEENTATKYVVLLKERAGDTYARAVVEVDAAPPNIIRNYRINAIETPEEYMPPRLSDADAVKALREEIAKQVAADQFSGTVIVAKNGKPIFAEAFGLADREKKIANTLDTRFRIGSMNKMFTAVAMLQLVQAGKVKLDDPIGKYLTTYPNKDVASKVTIHHLLSHQGGTGDIFGPDFDKHRLELKTHDDYLKLYGERALLFEPGAEFRYSNYGMVLAGAVIEKVTKKTYYDAVTANVFKPAKMKLSASPPEEKNEKGRVVGYTRESPKGAWENAAKTLPYRGTAAGGGDSTVNDLLAFANALTSKKLLDAKHLELLTTSHTKLPGSMQYGYGMFTGATRGVNCFGHGGGAPGMNGMLTICESGYTIAVLANVDPPAADRLAKFVQIRLPAK